MLAVKKRLINRIKKIQSTAEDRGRLDRLLLSTYGWYRGLKRKVREVDNPHYSRLYLRTRNLKRNLAGKEFKFVSVDQALVWTLEWIKAFPRRYDLIVAVPRSGMFIGSLIALKLGRGLTTPELLQQGRYWHSSLVKGRLPLDGTNHILLVDDSMDTGRAMSKAFEQIRSFNSEIQISKACLIAREDTKSRLELYHRVLLPPRVFEWNILHRKIASYFGHGTLAVDMDGVLCSDCPPGVDDDEKLYLEWISSARPYLIPEFEIDAIVTNRLERYRQPTEEWLQKHNVRYNKLYLWDVPSKTERRGDFSAHKIDVLLQIKPDMYWESTSEQSREIWENTRIPTLCIDEMTMLS